MAIKKWLTDAAILAVFDKLEKGPVRISGVDPKGRDLVIWVSQARKLSKPSLKKGSE